MSEPSKAELLKMASDVFETPGPHCIALVEIVKRYHMEITPRKNRIKQQPHKSLDRGSAKRPSESMAELRESLGDLKTQLFEYLGRQGVAVPKKRAQLKLVAPPAKL
jgi:hypothetical protein